LRGWARETEWNEFRHACLRDRDGAATSETPMLLDELLDARAAGPRPGEGSFLPYGRVRGGCAPRDAGAGGGVADYAPDALARWAARAGVGGVCIEHFLLIVD
jgi:hypothetical protein